MQQKQMYVLVRHSLLMWPSLGLVQNLYVIYAHRVEKKVIILGLPLQQSRQPRQ